jgi:hypothetical protein
MNDTPLGIEIKIREMIALRTPAERLRMASGMFDAGKQLMIVGLRRENARLNEAQLRGRLFVRMYGDSFSPEEIKKIAAEIPHLQLD